MGGRAPVSPREAPVAVAVRVMVATTEDPGHAFPALSLARALRARGHEILVETSTRWREAVEDAGAQFAPAPEYALDSVADGDAGRPPLLEGARSRIPMIREYRPDVVVSDVFTPAPALAAEAAGVGRRTTLIALIYSLLSPGHPPYPLGLLAPRTPAGARAWRAAGPLLERLLPHTGWSRKLLAGLNSDRGELGLPPLHRVDGPVTDGQTLVATLPQLEYPRQWPAGVHVTGPMFFEWPDADEEPPPGDDPLVFVTSSSVSDPELKLVRAALEALAGERVRVVATMSRRGQRWQSPVPDNAVVLDWVPYGRLMSRASLVIAQGGHGAVTQALAAGVPLLVCPREGDMAENGARVTWAGAGLMIPARLVAAGPIRWAARRILTDGRFTRRAREIAEWATRNDGAARGAQLVERFGAEGVR